MKLRFSRRATLQVDAILGEIANKSPQGAKSVAKRIRQVSLLLTEHPSAGRMTARPRVRRFALVPYPYVVDYRVEADAIVILGVRHTSRRPIP